MRSARSNAWALAIGCAAASLLVSCAHFVVLNDPLSASEHNDLGVAYEAQGQLDLAAKEYRRALKRDPRPSRVRVNLGNVEAARGQWNRAEKSYRLALRDSSTNYDAMNNLAVALLRQGRRRSEAMMLAERATSGAPEDSVYRATLEELKSKTR